MQSLEDTPRFDRPLAAGMNGISEETLFKVARLGAASALEEMRLSRKLGRDDKGTGDPALGSIVRSRREILGLTQADLASNAGIHYTTVGKIETGDRGMSLQTFCKIGRWLGPSFVASVVDYVSDQQ